VRGRARLAVATAVLSLLVVAALALLGAGLWAGASAADRTVLARVAGSQAVLLVAGFLLVVAVLAVTVVRLFAGHVLTPRRIAADARLIATVNPAHRSSVRGPAELADLAGAVNELAARYESAERDVTARVDAGRAEVAQERNRLAALMSELAAAVLVCNGDGRILLYNAAARRLLEQRPDRPGVVGLGRSIFGILDRDLVFHVLDRARAGASIHATTAWAGRLLRVDVAPVPSATDEATGFVVLVEDVTRRTETARRRDALLRDLTEGVRAGTGALRGAIENLIDYPDMPASDRVRFAGIVREEAVALGARVDRLTRESADDLTDSSLHDDISGADLLAVVADTIAAGPGPRLSVEATGEPLWLSLDGYPTARAIAALLTRLYTDRRCDEVTIGWHPAGRYAALTMRWRGAAVDAQQLRDWTAEAASGAEPETIAEILARHEAQVWSQTDDDGAYLRLLLPMAADLATERATATTPAPAAPLPRARPEFYDFDLFQVTEAEEAWENRPLGEIAYTVFDTETTGLQPEEGDEIVAIGAVRIINGRLLRRETFDRLVDPRRSVPAASRRVHGITTDMLRGQPTIEEVLPAFARFADDTVLVGHNVSFDLAFLRRKQARTGVAFTQPVLDTLLLSAAVHPDHVEHTMEAIAARLGVDLVGRHSALGDALVTGEIFVRLLRLLNQRGVHTVGQAREAARHTYHARIDTARYGPDPDR
jgi:DNA polymerase III subunit epsilon